MSSLSLGLLGLAAVGELVARGRVRRAAREVRPQPFGAARHSQMSEPRRSFLKRISVDPAQSPEEFCVALSRALTQRFGHGLGQYSLCSNYLCAVVGHIGRLELVPPAFRMEHASVIWGTDELLRYSPIAFCDQVSRAFADIVNGVGIESRVVALDGHIVAEARYEGRWHAFDPDYDVIPSRDGVVSVSDLVADPALTKAVYQTNRFGTDGALVCEIIKRGTASFQPRDRKASLMGRLQQATQAVKWVLPVLGLFWSLSTRRT